MPYRLDPFSDVGLDESLLALVIHEHEAEALPRLTRFWSYYRNQIEPEGVGAARRRLSQEQGLPARLTRPGGVPLDDRAAPREIVIENDIAWRIHTMVDFMFGRPVLITSTAGDEETRGAVERVLDAVWEASGGIALMQDMALLGHVYGHVDLLLRVDESLFTGGGRLSAAEAAELVRIEVVEPTRGIPLLSPADYRRTDAYVIHFERELSEVERARGLARLGSGLLGHRPARRRTGSVTEIHSALHFQRYEDDRLVADRPNRATPGRLPVVHIQNISEPFQYHGLGEVEPLIPLQDELNTRLCDRASRVTMQAFKMYLAKGIDQADLLPVGPGRIWTTDNPDASLQAFGGDSASPGEEAHIQEVREALDKTSTVPPLASGVVRAKIGNLSSANALRITLMGLLSKTARKRITYGRGIAQMSGLILTALDAAGVLPTGPGERGVRLEWPDPLPHDVREQVLAAKAKSELGVPEARLLAELGYAPTDPGVM